MVFIILKWVKGPMQPSLFILLLYRSQHGEFSAAKIFLIRLFLVKLLSFDFLPRVFNFAAMTLWLVTSQPEPMLIRTLICFIFGFMLQLQIQAHLRSFDGANVCLKTL